MPQQTAIDSYVTRRAASKEIRCTGRYSPSVTRDNETNGSLAPSEAGDDDFVLPRGVLSVA